MDGVILAPAHLIRSFFILASIAALSVNAIPILRQRFLLYGSRQADVPSGSKSVDISNRFLDALAKLQVPHSWFIHFYIASVASSLIWAYQIVTNGVAFQYIASFAAKHEAATCSMTVNQIAVTWALMTLQGCRRLYECCTLGKPSQAKMPIVSWVLGIAFYIAVGLSVWIEGIRMSDILMHDSADCSLSCFGIRYAMRRQSENFKAFHQNVDCSTSVCLCFRRAARLP